jgi:DNA repair protein RadA/Sms
VVAGGKNRFGAEGEMAWFEMTTTGLAEVDPASWLASGRREVGSAMALPMAGRRALAVEVQALVVPTAGSARRQTTGLDTKRFSLVAAVVDRVARVPVAAADLYGASSGGLRLDDPGCDLAVAAALVSAATGSIPPDSCAFIGEIGLTGTVRPVPGLAQRIAAARARGISTVFAPVEGGRGLVPIGHLTDALGWAR